MSSPSVDHFVRLLSDAPDFPGTFNPWRDDDPIHDLQKNASIIRAQNLRSWMLELHPKIILIGEAPSHHGAKFSGIPFTDPLMFEDLALTAFAGLKLTNTAREPEREMSGRAVWEITEPVWRSVFLWNAFAFHPYAGDDVMSNRAPKRSEIEVGKYILLALLELYPDARVVPVGQKAADTVQRIGVTAAESLRHPAFGGRKIFQDGLKRILKELQLS